MNRKVSRAFLAALILGLSPLASMATEANRVVAITSIHPVSNFRPGNPDTQGITRVYFTAGAFGSTTCRNDAADIASEDWPIYSTIMSGWRDGKTITLHVDDAAHLVAGDVTCRIVAARVQ